MMYCGVDIVKTERIKNLVSDRENFFCKKAFTENELESASLQSDKIIFFSTRFAAKEAVFKALNISPSFFRFTDIEISEDYNGRPHVELFGKAKSSAEKNCIGKIDVSISYDGDYAVAFAVAEEKK